MLLVATVMVFSLSSCSQGGQREEGRLKEVSVYREFDIFGEDEMPHDLLITPVGSRSPASFLRAAAGESCQGDNRYSAYCLEGLAAAVLVGAAAVDGSIGDQLADRWLRQHPIIVTQALLHDALRWLDQASVFATDRAIWDERSVDGFREVIEFARSRLESRG